MPRKLLAGIVAALVLVVGLRSLSDTAAGAGDSVPLRAAAHAPLTTGAGSTPREPRVPSPGPRPADEEPRRARARTGEVELLAPGAGDVAPTPDGTGRLTVRVLDDGVPVPALRVRCAPLARDSDFLVSGELAGPSSVTGGDGRASFDGLRSGRHGLLLERADGSAVARAVVHVAPEGATERVLSIGTASVGGNVHDDRGALVQGVRVLVRQEPIEGEERLWFGTRTDARGAWRLDGIAASRVLLAGVYEQDTQTDAFQLARDEHRSIDFGSPLGAALWTGTLRMPSGTPVRGFARLWFVTGAGRERGFADGTGVFRQAVPLGPAELRLWTVDGPLLAQVEIDGDVELDVTLPGVVLHGTLEYVGAKHAMPSGPEDEAVVALVDDEGRPVDANVMRRGSSYLFFGLEPGRYGLTTTPWVPAATPSGHIAIDLRAEDVWETRVDVPITDPR